MVSTMLFLHEGLFLQSFLQLYTKLVVQNAYFYNHFPSFPQLFTGMIYMCMSIYIYIYVLKTHLLTEDVMIWCQSEKTIKNAYPQEHISSYSWCTASLQRGNAAHCAVLISYTFGEYMKKQGRRQPAQAMTYTYIQKESLHSTNEECPLFPHRSQSSKLELLPVLTVFPGTIFHVRL